MTTTFSKYNLEVANGDPVIAVPVSGDGHLARPAQPITLGTGFNDADDLERQLRNAIETGTQTQNITTENAKELEGATRIDLFTIGAVLEHEQELEKPDQ